MENADVALLAEQTFAQRRKMNTNAAKIGKWRGQSPP